MRTIDLLNLEERMEKLMGNIDNMEERMGHMEENMQRLVQLIQNPKEKLPKGDEFGQRTQEDKNSTNVEKPSIGKNVPRGFDSNNGSNQGVVPKGYLTPQDRHEEV